MKPHAAAYSQRLLKGQAPTYERLQARLAEDGSPLAAEPIAVHCGWGRDELPALLEKYRDL